MIFITSNLVSILNYLFFPINSLAIFVSCAIDFGDES